MMTPVSLGPGLDNVKVTLHNADLWASFHEHGTEMIITKNGRRMFPYLRLEVTGLDPYARYFLMLEMTPASNSRFKFSGSQWVAVGSAEPQLPASARLYVHPDSPATGAHWSGQHVLLNKIKLTNNNLDNSGNIILHSMHKYLPRVHIVMATDVLAIHWSPRATFDFPETAFMAVTAYQNENVTKLKINNNPFAKGFRDVGNSRKRKAEQLKGSEKIKKESTDTNERHLTVADDSGISSVGSPTPPVLSPPVTSITSFSDYYAPALAMPRLLRPEIPAYLQPALWSYPYLLPPPPPLYPSPYLQYLVPPLYQPSSESYLIDLSVKRDPVTLTKQ